MKRIYFLIAAHSAAALILYFFLENKHLLPHSTEKTDRISWSFDHDKNGWIADTAPPACPEPLTIAAPVDLPRASGILYPGQYRGGDYKAHGGFRFDTAGTNDITVRAVMDARLFKASRYLSDGEAQYLLFFINDCGIMYMHDHVAGFPEKIERALGDLPPATEGDSRTTPIEPPVSVEKGDVIATKIGIEHAGNIFVDFGLYDVRKWNDSAADPAWRAAHPDEQEYGYHGLCWIDFLPDAEMRLARSLPTGKEGKTSDYCD